MLDRKTMLAVSALVLLMIACAIWLVGHMQHWPVRPFVLPASVMILAGALQWLLARAEGDLSAWRKWGGIFVISYASICTGYELIFVMKVLQVTAPPTSLLLVRLMLASFGALFLVLGNWIAKLPPVRMRRSASLSFDMAGEATMLRLAGWLLVAYGLVLMVSALLIPVSLFAPLNGSMSLAVLIVVLIRQRQLKARLR
jgi:hypothetical protein